MPCDVENLSLGGVLLQAEAGASIELSIGMPVVIELHLVGPAASWLAGRGHVQRLPSGERFAVAFDDLSAELEDVIEDEVLAAVEATARPRVVVVDRSDQRRRRLTAALRRAGCRPLAAATPLEAIALIEQSRTHAAAVIVAEQLTQTHGDELARFFAQLHPELRVAIIREPGSTEGHDGVVTLDDADCDHSGPVRELVFPRST